MHLGSLLALTPADTRTLVVERQLLEIVGARPGNEDDPFASIVSLLDRAMAYPPERRLDLEWRWNGLARAFMKMGSVDVFAAIDVYPEPFGDWMIGDISRVRIKDLAAELRRSDLDGAVNRFDAESLVRDQVSDWERWKDELPTLPAWVRKTVALLLRAAEQDEAILFIYQ